MKKVSLLLVIVIFTFLGTQCASTNANSPETGSFELALISDGSTIETNAFIRGIWEGITRFGSEKRALHKFYLPAQQNEQALLAVIDEAVNGGAKIIVAPGYNFKTPVYIAQDRYPDVKFILVDSVPRGQSGAGQPDVYRPGENTVGILYAEDQAGFLAGYAAVKDGYRRLGFMGGMAIPTVVRYGYGFIQGAEYAAMELNLKPGSVTVKYHYTGDFAASRQTQSLASSWYGGGTEVIFACGGGIGSSVMVAAEQAGKKVIGADIDQSGESSAVISSAVKGLRHSVYTCIAAFYAGRFPGGQTLVFSAANNGVGLPMTSSRFKTFSNDDYNAVFKKLADGSIPRITHLDSKGKPDLVPVSILKIEEIL
jgi:basic membrane protein A